jgi:hypothetical protein
MAETRVNEPPHTRNISNETVCNYYYYLSIAILFIGTISIFAHIYLLFSGPGKFRVPIIFNLILTIITLGIAYFIYLFAFVMCSRSLIDKNGDTKN